MVYIILLLRKCYPRPSLKTFTLVFSFGEASLVNFTSNTFSKIYQAYVDEMIYVHQRAKDTFIYYVNTNLFKNYLSHPCCSHVHNLAVLSFDET